MTNMSREIKFRLVKDGKIVGYEKWDYVAGWIYAQKVDGVWESDGMGRLEIVSSISHDSKEPFVGVLEKNGVEIYERDRVRRGQGYAPRKGGNIYEDFTVTFWQEDNRMGWHLGDLFNEWKGEEVEVVGRESAE